VRKNVKNPLQELNEEVLGATFTLLRTVPVRPSGISGSLIACIPWLSMFYFSFAVLEIRTGQMEPQLHQCSLLIIVYLWRTSIE